MDTVEKKTPKTECITQKNTATHNDANNSSVAANLFDQYTIYSKIGSGGMGIVYLAKDKRLDRFVSIKRLNHKAQSNPALRKRFLQEARAVASLNNVHIVHIYALGEDSDGPYIVMEYVAGPISDSSSSAPPSNGTLLPSPPLTLEQYTTRNGSLSADEAINIMVKISSAITYAHNCGVIHRDLKPSNILLDESNEPKIVDFGLARLMHGNTEVSKLTVPGEKLISLGYGAPEQEKDASASDERSDVYGLGALLYFMLTGQNPRYFREQDVPVSLRELVVKSLAPAKEQRLPSASAFMEALKAIQTRTRVETPAVKTTWRCKWCDAVNSVLTRFCAECGWDGREACPECGAETFIGMQYCSSCGADIRSYETILNTIRKINDDFSCGRFESVVSGASQIHGFEPAGQSGRKYLQEVQSLKSRSEKNIALRKQLAEQISIELKAENYERARRFILQYREVTKDNDAFSIEEGELPEKTLKRDLGRIRRSILRGDWNTAANLCQTLNETVGQNNETVMRLARHIRIRRNVRKTLRWAMALLLAITFYLLLCPLVLRHLRHPATAIVQYLFAPARYIYSAPPVAPLLNKYATFILPDDMCLEDCFVRHSPYSETSEPLPDTVLQKRKEYEAQLKEFRNLQTAYDKKWAEDYKRELLTLSERFRQDGNYEAWEITDNELKIFSDQELSSSPEADSIAELALLRQKYQKMKDDHNLMLCRKVITLCNQYINVLTDFQRNFMQNKKMDLAAAINNEIRTARESEHLKKAKEMMGKAEPSRAGEAANAGNRIFEQTFADIKINEAESALEKLAQDVKNANAATTESTEKWSQTYSEKLQQRKIAYQSEGNYDGVLAAEAELQRFRAERTLDESDILFDQSFLQLRKLQEQTILQLKSIKNTRAKKIVGATDQCASTLAKLQKKFTVGGDMKSAAAIDAKIKNIRTTVDYLGAKQELEVMRKENANGAAAN